MTLKSYWGWRTPAEGGDVLIHALPIFHVHGLFVASHGALLAGAKMLWLDRFDASAVVALLPRATVFMGVPTLYVRMLAEPALDRAACRNMRLFISGSAPMLVETFEAWRERTGHTILERYGMSETAMLTSNPYLARDGERRGGTVGFPLPGVELRIRDDRGNALGRPTRSAASRCAARTSSRGYWRMPEKTREEFAAGGWFRTGDVGRIDARGYVAIVGRSKDLIISGGYNVYPAEVEAALNELPGVAESAVFGVPHADFGEAVTAVVVARGGARLDGDIADRRAEGEDRQLQGAEGDLRRRRAAAKRDGQGAEEPAARALRARCSPDPGACRRRAGRRQLSDASGISSPPPRRSLPCGRRSA